MSLFKNKLLWGVVACVLVAGALVFAHTVYSLRVEHSTFENYYAFRGCQTLVDRTDTYGDCTLADGSTIRIVKYNNKWFLDGDLPVCALSMGSFCPFNWP